MMNETPVLDPAEQTQMPGRVPMPPQGEIEPIVVNGERLIQMDLADFAGYLAIQAEMQLSADELAQLRAHDALLAQHRAGRIDQYFGTASQARQMYEDDAKNVAAAQAASDEMWGNVKTSEKSLLSYARLGEEAYYEEQKQRQVLKEQLKGTSLVDPNIVSDQDSNVSYLSPRKKKKEAA